MKRTENNLIDKEARIIKFKDLFKEVFTEERCDELCEALDKLHFFSAPASTQYHGNYGGGLFDHSYEVTMALLQLTRQLNLTWERPESPYIVGMLHDLCKADCYAYNTKDKVWRYKKELTLTGHGEKSVIRAQQLMNLTEEEILCIRWHMRAYDDKENWNTIGAAIEKYPNVLFTHTADMMAARIVGI